MSTVEGTENVDPVRATPDNTPATLVPTLLSIAKSTRAFLTLLLAEIGLHPGQDQLLQSLKAGEATSVSTLAEQLAVRPSTVSKMLDRLIERNLVRRAVSNQDARRTMVALTSEGEKARAAVGEVWGRLEAELWSALEPDEHDGSMRHLRGIDVLLASKLRRLR